MVGNKLLILDMSLQLFLFEYLLDLLVGLIDEIREFALAKDHLYVLLPFLL